MNCTDFQRKNSSSIILNHAMNDDSGSWWWWINTIGNYIYFTRLILIEIYSFENSS